MSALASRLKVPAVQIKRVAVMKNELRRSCLLRHPIVEEEKRGYYLMLRIVELIEYWEEKVSYGKKIFEPETKVEDLEIEHNGDGFFEVGYKGETIDFVVRTHYECDMEIKERFEESMYCITTDTLYENLKAEYKEGEKKTAEIVYENQNCPVCFDEYEEEEGEPKSKYISSCGHMFCDSCAKDLIEYNGKCGLCRQLIIQHDEPYTKEDIEQLKREEDNEKLLEIINIDGVIEDALRWDGYEQILGYEYLEAYRTEDRPKEYYTTGEEEYIVAMREH